MNYEYVPVEVSEEELRKYLALHRWPWATIEREEPRSIEFVSNRGEKDYGPIAKTVGSKHYIMRPTPELFVHVHGDDGTRNQGCLEDIACMGCGNRDRFNISVTMSVIMSDEGSESNDGDQEYSDDTAASCKECDECGTLAHFRIEGLDSFLLEKDNETEAHAIGL